MDTYARAEIRGDTTKPELTEAAAISPIRNRLYAPVRSGRALYVSGSD